MTKKRGNKEIAATEEKKMPQIQQPGQVDYVMAAMEKGMDFSAIEKFMDLQERNNAYEAKKQFVAAMSAFRADCPSIVKTKEGHNSKYAGLAETIDQIKGILAKCGLSHSWRTEQKDNKIIVTCIVTHVAGHSESTSLESPPETSGNKNDIQAIGSAVEYMKRYTFFAILGLSSGDEDNDGGGNQEVDRITENQANELYALLSDNDIEQPKVMTWLKGRFKIDSFEAVSVAAFQDVKTGIRAKIKAKANK
jgi:hypothetical protein